MSHGRVSLPFVSESTCTAIKPAGVATSRSSQNRLRCASHRAVPSASTRPLPSRSVRPVRPARPVPSTRRGRPVPTARPVRPVRPSPTLFACAAPVIYGCEGLCHVESHVETLPTARRHSPTRQHLAFAVSASNAAIQVACTHVGAHTSRMHMLVMKTKADFKGHGAILHFFCIRFVRECSNPGGMLCHVESHVETWYAT